MSNSNFGVLASTTFNNHRKKLVDNVFLNIPLLWWFTEKNRVRFEDGGLKIVEPLIYDDGQALSYGEWEQITITPQTGITAAEFDWRQIASTIAISGLEELKNTGRSQIINLLRAKIMQSEKTLKNSLGTMLWSDGTGNSNKDFLGLLAVVGDDTIGPNTVGGIADSNVYWRSPTYDKGSVSTTAPAIETWLRTAWNAAADGTDTVDAIFAATAVHELYEAGLTGDRRYQDVKAANAGFTTLTFKGAPVFLDKNAPAGAVVGVNSDYMALVGHKDRWFKQSAWSGGFGEQSASNHASTGTAATVDGRFAVISAAGNLTVSNRQRHFRLVDVGEA